MKEIKLQTFVNWTREPFIGTWDSKEYHFAPGQNGTFEEGIARHFAKQLAQREIVKNDKMAHYASARMNDDGTYDQEVFNSYFVKGLILTEAAVPTISDPLPDPAPKKAGKKAPAPVAPDDEFAD